MEVQARTLLLASLLGAVAFAAYSSSAARPPFVDDDEAALRKAGVKVDGDELLAYLRRRGGADDDLTGIDQLVRDLGAPAYRTRVVAAVKLISLGPVALPRLRKAAKESEDREVVRSAKRCADLVAKAWDYEQHRAAVRLLARRAGAGTTPAFLHHLPYIADEEVEADIWYSLDAMARKGIDPAFRKALASPFPSRRAVAGFVLGRYGDKKQRDDAFGLLSDADATVRLRTAQGMLGAKNKAGVPALIALLDQPSIALAWQAEELLHYTAGKASPKELVGAGSAKSRAECRKAWEAWWKLNGGKVDLQARAGLPLMPGLVLLSSHGNEKSPIALSGCNGPHRWELHSKPRVVDVNLLTGDRLLIAQVEKHDRDPKTRERIVTPGAVVECDLTGKPLWQYKGMPCPLACRRLPNGNTIVVDDVTSWMVEKKGGGYEWLAKGVVEVTLEGRRVFQRHMRQDYSPLKLTLPFILGNGRLFYKQEVGDMREYDLVSGKEFRQVMHKEEVARAAGMDPLGNGRYLLALPLNKEVREVDAEGNTVWRYPGEFSNARRLRNGNTLISCRQRGPDLIEVTPDKRVVWTAVTKVGPYFHLCLPLVKLGFDGKD